jgi:hypothetical protein
MEELNEKNGAHLGILRIMRKYNLLEVKAKLSSTPEEGATKGLPSPIGIGKGIGMGKGKAERPPFVPPTLDEVETYMTAQMPAVTKRCPGAMKMVFPSQEAPKFVGHYTQHEWKVKSKPMISWQQTAYNWLIKSYQFKQEKAR